MVFAWIRDVSGQHVSRVGICELRGQEGAEDPAVVIRRSATKVIATTSSRTGGAKKKPEYAGTRSGVAYKCNERAHSNRPQNQRITTKQLGGVFACAHGLCCG
jgi:hypothetical protein